jgi:integrase
MMVNPAKSKGSVEREKVSFKHLKVFFGSMPLSEIKKGTVAEYRVERSKSGHSFITINREIAFLRFLLNLASEDELIETVPRIKLPKETGSQRTRTLDADEYKAILAHIGREQQRYYIALFESSMRLREPTKLTWDKIDLKRGLIRLQAEDVKERWPRRTPISWELRQVLEELKEEQKKVPNLGSYVFTRRNGKPIRSVREAWLSAVEKAFKEKKVPNTDLVPHDLRRTAITRWTALGIPRDVVMAASGHKPGGVHDGYINFSDEQLTFAFRELMLPPAERTQRKPQNAVNL